MFPCLVFKLASPTCEILKGFPFLTKIMSFPLYETILNILLGLLAMWAMALELA